jgi:hypothetical protein
MKVLVALGILSAMGLVVIAAIAMEQSYEQDLARDAGSDLENYLYLYDCVQRERIDLGFTGVDLHFRLNAQQIQHLKDYVAREFENAIRESACERERI